MIIYGTGKNKHLEQGKAYEETESMATLLVAKGAAIYEFVQPLDTIKEPMTKQWQGEANTKKEPIKKKKGE